MSHLDEKQPEDLNQAILTTLKLANNELKYKCEVLTQLGDLPLVQCNIGKINQVVLNLVVNASHAVEEGGEIRIVTSNDGDEVFFSVRDNGCGIEADALSKLFDPFFTTKAVGQGTGLGLSLSHGIIEEHGGRLEVQSEPGEGAVFTVFLPLEKQAA